MSKATVGEYLKGNLKWRVLMLDDTVLPLADVPHLEVAVMAADVQMPVSKSQLPVWGAFEALTEITQGKTCGYTG